ncbi:MAG TPA: 4-alpha-glucanotransferase, partial [Ilumatobacteraceae bacterium]|nr:4-alpha-glucanotransferase [Ilumatobacteraceae bacterium]
DGNVVARDRLATAIATVQPDLVLPRPGDVGHDADADADTDGDGDGDGDALIGPAIAAAHAALLASPAAVRLVSMDDMTASTERPNHPGTLNATNWRRRLSVSVDDILAPR